LRTRGKNKKYPSPLSPLPKEKKLDLSKETLSPKPSSHWLHEIFSFQKCSSPFFAWASTPKRTGIHIIWH